MRKIILLIAILFVTIGITIGFSVNATAQQPTIPSWIKNTAKWWGEGQINDDEFIKALQWLIDNKVMIIPSSKVGLESNNPQIPNWVKNNAKWWAEGQLGDSDFVQGIQYLIANGIVHLHNNTPNETSSNVQVDVSDVVQQCTKPYPYINEFNVQNYVDPKCLIDNAKTVEDCQAYRNVRIMELREINPQGNVKTIPAYFNQVGDCVTNLAIQNHDVNDCNSLKDSTQCIISYSKQFKEPQYCNMATDYQGCFKAISYSLGLSVCKVVDNDEGIKECAKNYFKDVWDGEISNLYGHCLGSNQNVVNSGSCFLQWYSPNGLSSKDKILLNAFLTEIMPNPPYDDAQRNDYSIASIGDYEKDLSVCDKAGTARAECYGAIANTEDFVTVDTCNKLDQGKSYCIMHVAYRLDEPSICDITGDNKQNCINLVNSKNQH